ncbi:hypothetical protein GF362_04615 [Candidatus Dojkabacteria bacterium]|nr:hypothetical protein [Candidatus Dojkabacteria bacterium]
MYQHFDLNKIYEYFGKDKAIIQELIEKFKEEITEGIKGIEIFLQNEEYEGIADISHRIKSSLQYFGAEELHDLIINVEKIAKSQNGIKQIPVLIEKFNKIYQELEKELIEYKNS